MSEQPNTGFDVSRMTEMNNQVNDDLVVGLVGEGKKFKTVGDLAKGKLEADDFIERLKTENKALRETLEKESNPDDVLAKISNYLSKNKEENGTTATPSSNQSTKEPLSEEKVLELLGKRDQQERAKSNVSNFNATVAGLFKDKASEVVSKRLGDLGMEGTEFTRLVEKNPKAALALLGVKESAMGSAGSTTMQPSVNTEAYFGDAGGVTDTRNFAYFQKLRREMGEKYYSPEMQAQVFEARKKLGDAFWK
jgi:hypothetical protein